MCYLYLHFLVLLAPATESVPNLEDVHHFNAENLNMVKFLYKKLK